MTRDCSAIAIVRSTHRVLVEKRRSSLSIRLSSSAVPSGLKRWSDYYSHTTATLLDVETIHCEAPFKARHSCLVLRTGSQARW